MDKLKKNILSIFQFNGLTLKSECVKYLSQFLEQFDNEEREKWIQKVIEAVQNFLLTSPVIDQSCIQKAIDVVRLSEDDGKNLFQVINIFNVKKWNYSIERKKFVLNPSNSHSLFGNAENKATLFKNRYNLVYQRTLSHEKFRRSELYDVDSSRKFELVKVEYLMSTGAIGNQSTVVVLGLLTQLVEGTFYLEDDTGAVKLNLNDVKFHMGLFTHNSFVIIEGTFGDGVLTASVLGLPFAESSETTRALVGNVNYFGGSGNTCAKYSSRLLEMEKRNPDAMIVVLSDIWLDNLQVMEKLEQLLNGFEDCPPVAIIFCGNFLSTANGSSQFASLQTGFNSLADMISGRPGLSSTIFVFVPGSNDPVLGKIYPRPPLPSYISEKFKAKVPRCEFACNPCRIRYCTKEIVVFREDVFTKLCRNCIFFPSDSSDVAQHFAATLVSGAHLSPLPLHTIPIYWDLDHCLALHPTPDLIITADKGDPFTVSQNSALVMNPGSFVKTDFSFKVYFPFSGKVEDSQIE